MVGFLRLFRTFHGGIHMADVDGDIQDDSSFRKAACHDSPCLRNPIRNIPCSGVYRLLRPVLILR